MEMPSDQPPLSAAKKAGYVVLIVVGLLFSLVTAASFGNVLGWLAVVAAVGLVGTPTYALAARRRIAQLPLIARVLFWLAVLAATCFVVLMVMVVFALRNNFS